MHAWHVARVAMVEDREHGLARLDAMLRRVMDDVGQLTGVETVVTVIEHQAAGRWAKNPEPQTEPRERAHEGGRHHEGQFSLSRGGAVGQALHHRGPARSGARAYNGRTIVEGSEVTKENARSRHRVQSGARYAAILGAVCLVGLAGLAAEPVASQQDSDRTPRHGEAVTRLLIDDAMVIYGSRRPPFGPMDILIEQGHIVRMAPSISRSLAEAVIDGRGKYVMPGLVNTHMHWHDERGGVPQPIQYERNLYLASGVTTTRELGGEFFKSKRWQSAANANTVVSPRMQVYWAISNVDTPTPAALRASVREAKDRGADGLKVFGMDRDQLAAVMDEARRLGMRTATHISVEETNAVDFADQGVNSIEHFYGVADAALPGVQHFPPDMNYSDEVQRFARAGELYAQADPERLRQVLQHMVEKEVAWTPTFSIYEASRDVIRAQNQPWFKDYLHPALEQFFRPNPDNHGSYFGAWTSTQEARWSRNFRIWMDAVRTFARLGGKVTTGDDAGYIYSVYGFGLIRELELQEEAGFEPLEVIEHATYNGAVLLGLSEEIGRVRVSARADLLVVNGNPLENLRVLNPAGADLLDGGRARRGGIEWTIKDGIPYHAQTLMNEVRDMVRKARGERPTTAGR